MIAAHLTREDGNSLGSWHFLTLPRVGEQVVIPDTYCEVLMVEHWPGVEVASADDPYVAVRLRVREIPPPA